MRFNEGHVLSIAAYSVLFVISATGNLTVFFLLLQRRRGARSRINTMLLHLAIADLLVSLRNKNKLLQVICSNTTSANSSYYFVFDCELGKIIFISGRHILPEKIMPENTKTGMPESLMPEKNNARKALFPKNNVCSSPLFVSFIDSKVIFLFYKNQISKTSGKILPEPDGEQLTCKKWRCVSVSATKGIRNFKYGITFSGIKDSYDYSLFDHVKFKSKILIVRVRPVPTQTKHYSKQHFTLHTQKQKPISFTKITKPNIYLYFFNEVLLTLEVEIMMSRLVH